MEKIEFEYYKSGKDCLLILTGIGGTTKGYQNKYETIARNVVEKFNLSVIVATTPLGSWQHTKENINYIMEYVESRCNGRIYTMGNSAGGNILLMHSYLFPTIVKLLAVNPVLNVNLHKINKGIEEFKGKVVLVCGEKDTSSKYLELINKPIKIIALPNIDHNFTNHLDLFIELIDNSLLL